MREYRFQATESSVEALRRLRSAWASFVASEMHCLIVLADGDAVKLEVDTVDVEGVFDAYRISATRVVESDVVEAMAFARASGSIDGMLHVVDNGKSNGRGYSVVSGFANGGNDVVLFSGASWSEPSGTVVSKELGDDAVLLFSGHVGQVSETAEIVCITTDAFVVASPTGVGLLFRTGLKPESIEVVRDADEVRAFLLQRGYGEEGAG